MGLKSFVAAAAAVLALAATSAQAEDTVHVVDGPIHGVTAGGVTSFKGIPFAAPPVGELRWRPPQPAKPWTGILMADKYGPACMQMSRGRGNLAQSEDCLYLNVWEPASATPRSKLPVMVWIYGGAFIGGAGSLPYYDGTHFAERGVILVTVNYRLGRLGFFAHPALTAETPQGRLGDYGLMDNIAALRWVQDNISQFGGDPSNVTIFGESAGGILVNWLMTAPDARGLFAKAISESGFGRDAGMPIRGDAPRTGEKVGEAFAQAHGITGAGPEAAKALRALSAEALSAPVSGLGDPGIPAPMVDGVVIPEPPPQAWAQGKEAKVPYIAGGNSWEASLFPASRDNPEGVLGRLGPARDKVAAAFGETDPARLSMDLTTTTTVIEPDRYLARLHTAHGQKAWSYYFSYVPAAQRAEVPGAGHGSEIVYVFGTLRDEPTVFAGRTLAAATPEDHAISKVMTDYWVAFAKRSDPDRAGGPAWLPAEPGDKVMEFGADGPHLRDAFKKPALDAAEAIAKAQAARR